MNDFKRLAEPLIPGLRRYAWALTRDADAADDLVQDTLERAISRWGQRRPDGDTRTWMFAILHNLAVSHLRRRARLGAHLPLDAAPVPLMAEPPPQEPRLRYVELMAALAALPEDQRSVLLLVAVEDLSYSDCARVLGVPVGTVMSRLSRARERLRRATAVEPSPARVALRRVK